MVIPESMGRNPLKPLQPLFAMDLTDGTALAVRCHSKHRMCENNESKEPSIMEF